MTSALPAPMTVRDRFWAAWPFTDARLHPDSFNAYTRELIADLILPPAQDGDWTFFKSARVICDSTSPDFTIT